MAFNRPGVGVGLVLVGLIFGDGSSAREVGLRLDVSGFISPLPVWKNPAGQVIDHINFEFQGIGDPGNPNQNVDSKKARARLENAPSYPATVGLLRPKKCSIGNGSIKNNDVVLVLNQIAHATDRDIVIPDSALQEFFLRFAASGGYNGLSGIVKCDEFGVLTYKY